jgi:hypothetical protein
LSKDHPEVSKDERPTPAQTEESEGPEPSGPILFASQTFDAEAAAEEARRSGLWANAALADRLWPDEAQARSTT